MPQVIDAALKLKLLNSHFRPAITLWNRLEGRARQADFSRSLRAEIRDPLWMLTRQWQLGEFKGSDGGSAAKARVQIDAARLDRFAVRSRDAAATGYQPAVPYDQSTPMEVQVERESIWQTMLPSADEYLALRAQMGRHWLRLLRAAGRESLRGLFVGEYGFVDVRDEGTPTEQVEAAHVQSDPAAWQVLAASLRRLPDGRRLLEAIGAGAFDSFVDNQVDPALRDAVKDLARDFARWFERLYSQPDSPAEDAWAPPYLEYQFASSAPADATEETRTTLVAEQYHHGRLDWYAFEVDRGANLEDSPQGSFPGGNFEVRKPVAFVPTQIEFNGMPNVRWWEFEDRRTDFGKINASTTDLPILLLAEFGLVYGNDWFVVPCNLPVGSLAEIKGLIVSDVFGVRTRVRAAGQDQAMDLQKWSMFGLNRRAEPGVVDRRLLLAPALAKSQEGDPIEKIIFARDEMTNMVWGVEERIPGALGQGLDGFERATAMSTWFQQRVPASEVVPEETDATIRYSLGNTVPENWIPFIATREPGSTRLIRLQRASMPRLTDAIPDSRVEPRSAVLRSGLDGVSPRQPYFLHQEQVPRAGVVVTRGFQRARWFDGKVFTWVGRRKQIGRRTAGSGLEFDRVGSVQSPKER
jgi:hypothetical protein